MATKAPNRRSSTTGLTLTAAGALSGLGNGDVLITIEATAIVTSTCTNQGSNQAPGQNSAALRVTSSQAIPEEEIKNGNTPFSVTTLVPDDVIPGAADCPNPNWAETIDDLAFTFAIITEEKPVGTLVLVVACTIGPPSSDGMVSKADVTCSQTQVW